MALEHGSLGHRLARTLVPPLFWGLARGLDVTCRWQEDRLPAMATTANGRPFIAAFWHYSLLPILMQARRRHRWVAMVSASADGEFAARILQRIGCAVVRGSGGRDKGGVAALKAMVGQMADGRSAAIVADGSKGPARQVQAGVIVLASHTGLPILPVAAAASRFTTLGSWDRTLLPAPFSTIALVAGEPLSVPGHLDATGREHYRQDLEARLNGAYQEAWARFGRQGHSPDG
ncbi:MAG: lysophospholipid acyltransferase family protein [Thermodesulfobacteriota bacterium]